MKKFSVKVVNRSVYETKALAQLYRLALKNKKLDGRGGRYVLEVIPSRHAKCSGGAMAGHQGRATLNGRKTWLVAEAPGERHDATTPAGFADLCWVLDHEALHLAGFNHGDMGWHDKLTHDALQRVGGSVAEGPPDLPRWARGLPVLPVRAREAPPAPSELRDRKIDHAEAMLARAETRARRAESVAACWRRRLSALRRAHLRLAGAPRSAP
jgi:hypothetical protein